MTYTHKTKDRMIAKLREERKDLRATIEELRRECIIRSPRHMAGTLEHMSESLREIAPMTGCEGAELDIYTFCITLQMCADVLRNK